NIANTFKIIFHSFSMVTVRNKLVLPGSIAATCFFTGPSPKLRVRAFPAHGSSRQTASPQRLTTSPVAAIITGQSGKGGQLGGR
ncbi:hypothetical protein MA065_004438, partial [Klebsiella pneumoniae]